MMTPTHAFVGALLGATTVLFAPSLTPTAVVVGFVGGALPDIDLLATHRRSTHYPVYATAAALPVMAAVAVAPSPAGVLFAVFLASAATHALMDALGGGVEVRPWEATSEKGVFNHATGRWIVPRRWVRYAGAPEDLALAVLCCLPTLLVVSGRLRLALLAVLCCSGLFTAVRRRLSGLTERLFADAADA
ncbi:metal-dependent hydrolase [Halorientalis litorea]|uniref:metal-dependent hydrolase n=1 Tax=Halorientalis litorea TaxID=2931977 RepID=UPI001FF60238|nr:metal-dependent hydrolase [Halorientalis litorea]